MADVISGGLSWFPYHEQ